MNDQKRFFLTTILVLSVFALSAQCSLTMTVPSDITICSPENIDLIGTISGEYISSEWLGTNGFQDDDLIASNTPTSSTTYTLEASASSGVNLVYNGDFELGDTGFTSSYLQGSVFCPTGPFNPWGILGCEGMYAVTTDPSSTHTNFDACDDHTSGSGNMMVVNGSSFAINIWCQDINIMANTDYLFSAWATSVNSSSPAILQFSINGNLIGSNFGLSGTTCQWEDFNATWNSAASTTATICVTNQNTAIGGNDFALDDIVFEEVCKQEMSFDVTIAEVMGALPTSNILNCDNSTIDLEVIPSSPNYTYNWAGNFGGTIDGPTDQSSAIGITQGIYKVTVTDENGCTKVLTSTINGSTAPPEGAVLGEFSLTCNMQEVTIISTNTDLGNTYNWIGSSDDPNLPFAIYDEAGVYSLEIINQFNCSVIIPFAITDNIIAPNYDIPTPEILSCIGDTIDLTATFDNLPNEIVWYDPSGNPISDGLDAEAVDIGYYVIEFGYSNGCNFSDSIFVLSQLSELDYLLGESPTINCTDSVQILSIDINDDYNEVNWFFNENIANTESVEVGVAGIYTVEILDNNGCITRDSVIVYSDFDVPEFVLTAEDIDCIDGLGTVKLITDSVFSVEWILPDNSVAYTDEINSSIAGQYIALLEHDNGCIATDTIVLDANQDFPVLAIESENLNCLNTIGAITASSNIADTEFAWTGPNGFSSNDQSLAITEPGQYIYVATTEEGCSSTDTIDILGDFAEPELELSSGIISCYNSTAQIELVTSETYVTTEIETPSFISLTDDILTVGEGGLTSITIAGSNGCETTETIEVIENFDVPAAIVVDDFSLDCNHLDSTFTLDLEPGTEQYWIIDSDTISTPTLTITSSNDYGIYVVDAASGCGISSYFNVSDNFESAEIGIEGNQIDCNFPISTINLDISQDVAEIDYSMELVQIDPVQYSVTEAGNYSFIVTYSNGCSATATIDISSDILTPDLTTQDITLPCTNQPVTLIASSTALDISYEWSGPDNFNSTASSPETFISGIYNLEITNNINGCTTSGQLQVFENQTDIQVESQTLQPNCPGDFGMLVDLNITGGTEPYNYVISQSNGSDVNLDELLAGMYTIDIIDDEGCTHAESFTLEEPNTFSTSLADELTIQYGTETTLNLATTLDESNISSIEWSPREYLSCDNCLNPNVIGLLEDTWFYVTISDFNGCPQSDSIFVRVEVAYSIYKPNVFTPNGDGINDIFYIQTNSFAASSIIEELAIFDRWGNKVFHNVDFLPNDPSEGWNGRMINQSVVQGVYAYYALVQLPDGTRQKLTGSVTIVR